MVTQKKKSTTERSESLPAYQVPQGEENLYHCRIERVEYDKSNGEKLSMPAFQKFGKSEFELYVKRSLEAQGYTVTVLYDPEAKGGDTVSSDEDGGTIDLGIGDTTEAK